MREIPLASNKYPGLVALIDDEDFEAVAGFRWSVQVDRRLHAGPKFYAVHRSYMRTPAGKPGSVVLLMHRLLVPTEKQVDHRDGNGLNNQRNNLRPANDSQNQANRKELRPGKTSRYRGVRWMKNEGKWLAEITHNYKHKTIGRFIDEDEAARAYDAAAQRAFGDFANLNFGTN